MTTGFESPYFFKLQAKYPINELAVSTKKSIDESIIRTLVNDEF